MKKGEEGCTSSPFFIIYAAKYKQCHPKITISHKAII